MSDVIHFYIQFYNKRKKNNKTLAAVTTLEKFWKIEDTATPTEDDDECLKIFDKTTVKDKNNRFIVSLTFKKYEELGDSRKQAMARFLNLAKKFNTNDELKNQYVQFMREYLEKGHMRKQMKISAENTICHNKQ